MVDRQLLKHKSKNLGKKSQMVQDILGVGYLKWNKLSKNFFWHHKESK
jgi:hypothetical protein